MVGEIILAVLWIVSGICFNVFVSSSTKRFKANENRIAALKKQLDNSNDHFEVECSLIVQGYKSIGSVLQERIENLESELAAQKDHQNQLTSEAIKPKIVPKRQNWRQFRSSVERATEEEA